MAFSGVVGEASSKAAARSGRGPGSGRASAVNHSAEPSIHQSPPLPVPPAEVARRAAPRLASCTQWKISWATLVAVYALSALAPSR